jgi:hypothetical protein
VQPRGGLATAAGRSGGGGGDRAGVWVGLSVTKSDKAKRVGFVLQGSGLSRVDCELEFWMHGLEEGA